ncbi:hypothetical protein [Glycomyces harbinensis]|uniref:SurA N-terminal domain-containing protein n=1 Tax=Glycomyces harbinensis TaxID=58114 RepID=A0A1G6TQ31_9ACTN|nr:hypothetical protein [Glycomyces harbinensis]SDD30984.1 hypothetical protein SAMN05216270_10382 [Glycomyces harbinensis]
MRTFRIAAVASVGLLALAGCGTEQGAALFVGDERISESTVDGYVELAEEANTDPEIEAVNLDLAPNRESAVLCVLFSELGQAMDLPEPDTAAAVDDFDAECTRASGYLDAISADVEPRELTEDELAHMADLGAPFEQLAPEDQAAMEAYAALSDALAGYFEEYDVRVNPRYGVDAFPLLAEGAEGLFEVEIPQR